MRIKAKRTSLGDLGLVRRGQERTVDKALGEKLVKRGNWEDVDGGASAKPKSKKGAAAPKGE